LGDGGVDALNVGATGGGGIILEFEAGLEATGKKLVCENSASTREAGSNM
jgi:hypothetical protein